MTSIKQHHQDLGNPSDQEAPKASSVSEQHPDLYRITYALDRAGLHVYGTTATSDRVTIDLGHIDDYGDAALRWDRATGWSWTVTEPDGQVDTGDLYGVPVDADANPDQVAWAMCECMTDLQETGASLRTIRTLARVVGPMF